MEDFADLMSSFTALLLLDVLKWKKKNILLLFASHKKNLNYNFSNINFAVKYLLLDFHVNISCFY